MGSPVASKNFCITLWSSGSIWLCILSIFLAIIQGRVCHMVRGRPTFSNGTLFMASGVLSDFRWRSLGFFFWEGMWVYFRWILNRSSGENGSVMAHLRPNLGRVVGAGYGRRRRLRQTSVGGAARAVVSGASCLSWEAQTGRFPKWTSQNFNFFWSDLNHSLHLLVQGGDHQFLMVFLFLVGGQDQCSPILPWRLTCPIGKSTRMELRGQLQECWVKNRQSIHWGALYHFVAHMYRV